MAFASPDMADFASFLQSLTKLDSLERITQDLDDQLDDSQKMMAEIKSMFDAIPNLQKMGANENTLNPEAVQTMLEDTPDILLDDMEDNEVEPASLDEIVSTMRGYAEEIKKRILLAETKAESEVKEERTVTTEQGNLDLEQYASSLDHLGKRLSNVNINNMNNEANRDALLEARLSQLCIDVDTFTRMVHAKAVTAERNRANGGPAPEDDDDDSLYYDNIINKLVAGVNEVTYMLQNNKN